MNNDRVISMDITPHIATAVAKALSDEGLAIVTRKFAVAAFAVQAEIGDNDPGGLVIEGALADRLREFSAVAREERERVIEMGPGAG